MTKKLTALATAAALSFSAMMPMAASAMDEELTMLEAAVNNQLEILGIETDIMALTVGQLTEIKGVLSSDDTQTEKKERVMAIIE
ncbi:hypothetical protein [Oceanomicrobium pacificus]|uniref:Uncharacterized protein n=1 Tax=Oceanomicrobium pacificus TaxID=2692916 RepID=A0A6B0TVW9_9RHOB|nr:hypothetical protein [Oceanomicrobium pacificus]MXU66839.1 hypothetical protein [Oceanomicrobium pacificus]